MIDTDSEIGLWADYMEPGMNSGFKILPCINRAFELIRLLY